MHQLVFYTSTRTFPFLNPALVLLSAESSDDVNKHGSAHLFCSHNLKAPFLPVIKSSDIINHLMHFFWSWMKTQDGTHQIQCAQEPIPCLARRRPETVWQSWCTGGRFESQNSQFSFSNGNMLSSLHILLRERRETERERDGETHRIIIINTAMHSWEQHKLKYSKLDLFKLEH